MVTGSGYSWVLEERDGARIIGETDGEVRGWGMPSGPFRVGRNAWSAARYRRGSSVGEAVVVDAALEAAVRRQYPDAAVREGFHVDGGALAGSFALWAVYSLITAGWWVGLRDLRREPSWSAAGTALRVLACALWPAMVASGLALYAWQRLGRPQPVVTVIDPELMVVASAGLAVALGVVLATRDQWRAPPA